MGYQKDKTPAKRIPAGIKDAGAALWWHHSHMQKTHKKTNKQKWKNSYIPTKRWCCRKAMMGLGRNSNRFNICTGSLWLCGRAAPQDQQPPWKLSPAATGNVRPSVLTLRLGLVQLSTAAGTGRAEESVIRQLVVDCQISTQKKFLWFGTQANTPQFSAAASAEGRVVLRGRRLPPEPSPPSSSRPTFRLRKNSAEILKGDLKSRLGLRKQLPCVKRSRLRSVSLRPELTFWHPGLVRSGCSFAGPPPAPLQTLPKGMHGTRGGSRKSKTGNKPGGLRKPGGWGPILGGHAVGAGGAEQLTLGQQRAAALQGPGGSPQSHRQRGGGGRGGCP